MRVTCNIVITSKKYIKKWLSSSNKYMYNTSEFTQLLVNVKWTQQVAEKNY